VNSESPCLDGQSLPMAGGLEVEQVHGDEGYNPESDDDGTDGKGHFAHAAVLGVEGSAFTDTKNLAENSDDENDAAENDCEQR